MERRYRNQDPYTLDNTVLKMAKKRPSSTQLSMLGAVEHRNAGPRGHARRTEPQPVVRHEPMRQQRQETKQNGDDKVSTQQLKMIHALMDKLGFDAETARTMSKQMFGKESSRN